MIQNYCIFPVVRIMLNDIVCYFIYKFYFSHRVMIQFVCISCCIQLLIHYDSVQTYNTYYKTADNHELLAWPRFHYSDNTNVGTLVIQQLMNVKVCWLQSAIQRLKSKFTKTSFLDKKLYIQTISETHYICLNLQWKG